MAVFAKYDGIMETMQQAHEVYIQTLDLDATKDAIRDMAAAQNAPMNEVEEFLSDPRFEEFMTNDENWNADSTPSSNGFWEMDTEDFYDMDGEGISDPQHGHDSNIANQNPQNLETISTVMDESTEVPAADSVVDANPSLQGSKEAFEIDDDDINIADASINDDEKDSLSLDHQNVFDRPIAGLHGEDNMAAVDGNGEVISANPYISTDTEKSTAAGGDENVNSFEEVKVTIKSDMDQDAHSAAQDNAPVNDAIVVTAGGQVTGAAQTQEGIIDVGDLPDGIIDVGDLPDGFGQGEIPPEVLASGGGDCPEDAITGTAQTQEGIIDVGDLPDGFGEGPIPPEALAENHNGLISDDVTCGISKPHYVAGDTHDHDPFQDQPLHDDLAAADQVLNQHAQDMVQHAEQHSQNYQEQDLQHAEASHDHAEAQQDVSQDSIV